METLADRIARDGPVNELDAIGWAIRLAKRLEALHQLGVAHGSVSPACILTAGQDRNARAYLADVQHTSSTPTYQSPERILGGDISTADDVWALAATLYALLTGQSPFAGSGDAEVRQKIMAASPAPLAVFDVGDDDLQHILDRAFARELGARTSAVNAFRRALEEWHPDRGVANLPPLEDEDSTNDDDDVARTVMVRDASAYLQHLQVPAAKPAAKQEVDDDDDNVRTVMRSMPGDDLAAIIARATAAGQAQPARAPAPVRVPGPQARAPGAPGPGAPLPQPRPLPVATPPRPAMSRQATFQGHPAPFQPQPPAPAPPPPRAPFPSSAFGGRPAPVPVVNEDEDDEDDDDNARTMMRSPEQMADSVDSGPRTMLLAESPDPWHAAQAAQRPAAGQPASVPRPAAGQPAPPPTAWGAPGGGPIDNRGTAPMGGYPRPGSGQYAAQQPPQAAPPQQQAAQGWGSGPVPAATMALPSAFDPPAPGFGGPDPRLGGGTQPMGRIEPRLGNMTQPMGGPGGFAQAQQAAAAQHAAQQAAAQQAAMQQHPYAQQPQQGPVFGDLAPPGDLSALESVVMQAPPAPLPPDPGMPMMPPSAQGRGGNKALLIVAALVALLIAAGVTFLLLRTRAG